MYELVFSDGQTVRADAGHLWAVSSRSTRKRDGSVTHIGKMADVDRRASAEAKRLRGIAAAISSGTMGTGNYMSRISGVRAPVLLRFVRAAGMVSVQLDVAVRPAGTASVPRRRVRFDSAAARRALHELAATKNDAFTERMDLGAFDAVGASLMTARDLVFACGLGVPASQDVKAMVRRLTKAGVRSVRDTHTVILFSKENVRTVEAFPVREVLIRYADHVEAGKDRAPRVQLKTTAELAAAVRVSAENAVNWAVDLSAPIAGDDIEAIIDPYVLGAWLGDGHTSSPTLTCFDQPILDEILAAGYKIRARTATGHYGIIGVIDKFRALNLLGNKHIPSQYLRASFNQRLGILQGLMDTDGTVTAQGTCELSLCHVRLAADALELIRSLGIKCTSTPSNASYVDKNGNRKVTGTRHRMSFTTSMPVFRLPRKLKRLPTATRPTQGLLYITSVTKVESEKVRCISVEAADGMYLTHAFIPTHTSPFTRNPVASL
ncbi:hypothetical protein ACSBOX_05810 [Arthrobacter sp. KN11-1C]|uniref:hypothetical protein n=1 Tax=Arthrobacter sp. KN11-1C TaxID=3445774 RepID=UPI003F9F01B9